MSMKRAATRGRRMRVGTLSRFGLALVALSFCAAAVGASPSATTSVGIRVERHTGLYLPGSTEGVSLASLRLERLPDRPATFGNSESSLIVSGDRPAALTPVSSGAAAPRVILSA